MFLPPLEGLLLIALSAYVICLLLQRVAGAVGLMLFQSLSIIIANIQAMKVVSLPFLDCPIAMGTEIMMVSFFASDLLCEHYGAPMARKGVMLSFISYGLFTCMMLLTTHIQLAPSETAFFQQSHDAITHLFTPAPAFFIASLVALAISQLADIWIFDKLRKKDGAKRLGIRTFLSTTIGSLLDTIVFSVLAWIVFAPTPLPLYVVLTSYIGGAFGVRLILSLFQAPLMYVARTMMRPRGVAA